MLLSKCKFSFNIVLQVAVIVHDVVIVSQFEEEEEEAASLTCYASVALFLFVLSHTLMLW